MAAHKTGGRCRRLVVTGCMAERYGDAPAQGNPGDRRDPRHERSAGHRRRTGGHGTAGRGPAHPATADHPGPASGPRRGPGRARPAGLLYDDLTPRTLTTPSHFAYIKIGEGCNYRCAFCIIPKLRGDYRSRTAESVVREARDLAARGVKEILLVSQDTTYFGNDRASAAHWPDCCVSSTRWRAWNGIRLLYLYRRPSRRRR